jgi:carboxylate-amine ligase
LAEASVQEISEVLPGNLPYWMEQQNRFRAGLRGLDAEYVIDKNGNHRPLRDVIRDLIEFCRPIATDIDETLGLQIARDLLNGPPGYQRQLDAYRSDYSARSVVKMLQRSLVDTAGTAFSNK